MVGGLQVCPGCRAGRDTGLAVMKGGRDEEVSGAHIGISPRKQDSLTSEISDHDL